MVIPCVGERERVKEWEQLKENLMMFFALRFYLFYIYFPSVLHTLFSYSSVSFPPPIAMLSCLSYSNTFSHPPRHTTEQLFGGRKKKPKNRNCFLCAAHRFILCCSFMSIM